MEMTVEDASSQVNQPQSLLPTISATGNLQNALINPNNMTEERLFN